MSDRDRRLCELMGIRDEGYWWCVTCLSEKSPHQVTYEENCTTCGRPVEWFEAPDFSTPEWRARLMDWATEQEWWGDFLWSKWSAWAPTAKNVTRGDFVAYLWRNLADLVYQYDKEKGR